MQFLSSVTTYLSSFLPSPEISLHGTEDSISFDTDPTIACVGYMHLNSSYNQLHNPRTVTILLGKKHTIPLFTKGYEEISGNTALQKEELFLVSLTSKEGTDISTTSQKAHRVYLSTEQSYRDLCSMLSVQNLIDIQVIQKKTLMKEVLNHSLGKRKISALSTLLNACNEKISILKEKESYSIYGHPLRLPFIVHIVKTHSMAAIRLEKKPSSCPSIRKAIACPISMQSKCSWEPLKEPLGKHLGTAYAAVSQIPEKEILGAIEKAKKSKATRFILNYKGCSSIYGTLKICPIRDTIESLLTIYHKDFVISSGKQKIVYSTFSLSSRSRYVTTLSAIGKDKRATKKNSSDSIIEGFLLTQAQENGAEDNIAPCLHLMILGDQSEMIFDRFSCDLFDVISSMHTMSMSKGEMISASQKQKAPLSEPLYVQPGEKETVDMQRRKLSIAHEICTHLKALHAAGIAHRDIKPENILVLIEDSQWKKCVFSDFGLSDFVETTGKYAGSYMYAPPEVIQSCLAGKASGISSPQSDIWSLGITLYYLFYGQTPYRHETIKHWIHTLQKSKYDRAVASLEEHIQNNTRHDVYSSVLAHLLRVDPKKRSSLNVIIAFIEKRLHPLPLSHSA